MTRPMTFFLLALAAAPIVAYGVYRLAKGLGFLDPPWSKEHEYRRTIVMALWAFLLFLCVFLFGWQHAWPRVWAVFGFFNAMALVVFGLLGAMAVRRLWKLRHPLGSDLESAPPGAQKGADSRSDP